MFVALNQVPVNLPCQSENNYTSKSQTHSDMSEPHNQSKFMPVSPKPTAYPVHASSKEINTSCYTSDKTLECKSLEFVTNANKLKCIDSDTMGVEPLECGMVSLCDRPEDAVHSQTQQLLVKYGSQKPGQSSGIRLSRRKSYNDIFEKTMNSGESLLNMEYSQSSIQAYRKNVTMDAEGHVIGKTDTEALQESFHRTNAKVYRKGSSNTCTAELLTNQIPSNKETQGSLSDGEVLESQIDFYEDSGQCLVSEVSFLDKREDLLGENELDGLENCHETVNVASDSRVDVKACKDSGHIVQVLHLYTIGKVEKSVELKCSEELKF